MPRVPDLIGRIRLDTRDLDRAKGEVSKFTKGVEGSGGKLGSALGSGLDGATTALTSRLGPAGDAVKGKLDAIGASAIASGSALKYGIGAGAAAGGLLLTKFATDGVSAFMDLAEQVRDFRRASGATAEDSSRFVAVFDDLQISTEAGATAIQKLAREVAAGAPKLRPFGIEVARNADGTSNLTETLLNVADAYSRAPDQATKASIGFAAFGRQAQSLLPLLDKGRDGLEEFFAGAEGHGQLLSEEDLAQAEELRLAIDEANDAMRGLQLIGAKALVPFITTVADAAAKLGGFIEQVERKTGGLLSKVAGFAGKGLLRQVGGPIGQAIVDFGDATDDAGTKADGATGSVSGLGSALDDTGAAATGSAAGLIGWGDSASRVAEQLEAINKSQDRRRAGTLSALDAEQASRRATVSFGDAVERITEIERDLVSARTSRTDATRAALTMERSLNAVEDAKTNILDAERALDRARAGRGQRARQLADAEKGLREAQEAVASAKGVNALRKAQEDLAAAETRVSDARAEGGQGEDVLRATEALADAQRDARSAALELAEAREESAKRQVAAEADITAARQTATDAALSAAKAAQELAERQAEAAGIPFTVDDGYRIFRDTLIGLKDQLAPGSELRQSLEGLINQVAELPEKKSFTVTADTTGVDNALAGVRDTVAGVQRDIGNALDGVRSTEPLPPVRLPVEVDTAPVSSALDFVQAQTTRTTREVRILGATAFDPFGTSAENASRRIGGINVAVGDVRSAVRDPLRLTADVAPANAALDGLRDTVTGVQRDIDNALSDARSTAPPPPLRLTVEVDTAPVLSALDVVRAQTARTTGEVRFLGSTAFAPFGASATEASGKITDINSAVGDVRSAVRDPLRLTADITQPITVLGQLHDLVTALRTDTENVLTALSTAAPSLTTPGAPPPARTTPVSSTSTTTVNNNTTVQALGANADVAREIDERQAKAAARAR